MTQLNVLVACEQSGIVRDAFAARGHNAWSCDLEPSDAPGNHYQMDAREALTKQDWDLMIAHPPCTRLANSGVSWLKRRNLWDELDKAASFFNDLLYADIPHIAVENPIPHKYAVERIGEKYDQLIQPYQFGHPESKATCLWLVNLPELEHTEVLEKPKVGHWVNQTPSGQNKLGPSKDRAKLRSKTYSGIAEAMADQWSRYIMRKKWDTASQLVGLREQVNNLLKVQHQLNAVIDAYEMRCKEFGVPTPNILEVMLAVGEEKE